MSAPLRVTVFTGARAEYGLLRPLMKLLAADDVFALSVLVSGMHLSERFGHTVAEVEADGFEIGARVPVDLDDDSEAGVARATAACLAGCADAFAADRPDLLVVLGDRFEVLAAATAAALARIPVAHLHGGELTQGAVDDSIRHAVTKLSLLHFAATDSYRRRIIQLGEEPARVFDVGAIGIDNALGLPLLGRAELESALGPVFGHKTAVVTYHPVTLEGDSAGAQMDALTGALESIEGLSVVLTAPNADAGNNVIFERIERFVERHPGRAHFFTSLGSLRYLSLVAEADVCVGNSSSGVIEAPSLGTPTVDIGDRQAGRERAASVLHCEPELASIEEALRRALSAEVQGIAATRTNPYGDGHTAERIAEVLRSVARGEMVLDVKKRFYDLPAAGECDE